MHILVDARFRDGSPGGIQQVVIGLAQGLSQVDLVGVRISFLMLEGYTAWLKPYLKEDFLIVCVPVPREQSSAKMTPLQSLKTIFRDRVGHLLGRRSIHIPSEPAIVKELNPDLIHFVHQNCYQTDRPFLFTPHDLQHEYYPEYFTKRTVMVRRYLYKYYAERARRVVCISQACRDDVVKFLGITADRCPIIYNAPVTEGYQVPTEEFLKSVRLRFNLPDRFFFYPARTYPHKNHLTLVRAVAKLRDAGESVAVVCSGAPTDFFNTDICPLIQKLDLVDHFHFVGFVSTAEINALYALATAMVFPSKFEGFGLPLIEAMRSGLPVACSNNSAIPEVVGDAALFFNAEDADAIASALRSLWVEDGVRDMLIAKGFESAKRFSWRKSATQYLQLYQSAING